MRYVLVVLLTPPRYATPVMAQVATMVSLAHSLRMNVVAKGVETEEKAKVRRLLRCDQMQGYLVGKPVPVADLCLPAL